jgi:hypothetical protein
MIEDASTTFDTFQADVDFMWRMAVASWGSVMLIKGRHDREGVAMVTLQMYHYVKNTVPVFQYALGRLGKGAEHAELRAMLEYFIEDEAGHDRVALKDLARMGYDPELCKQTLPLPTTLNLQGANKLAVDEYGPYYLVGETYATETVGAQVSQGIHDAYRHHPELGGCLAFYSVHGEADQVHAARSEATLRRCLSNPSRRRPLLLGCLTAWKNLMQLADEIRFAPLYPREFQLPPRGVGR